MRNHPITKLQHFDLLCIMCRRERITIDELAEAMNISVASVKRMLRTLRRMGLVYGRKKGSYLIDRQRIPFLETSVYAMLLIALNLVKLKREEQQSEEHLLKFAREIMDRDTFRSRTIFESGFVSMNTPERIILIVHCRDNATLYEYEKELEKHPCIARPITELFLQAMDLRQDS